ncbi:MAG: RnfABCDGE type electron transport complex subunit G, partial [Lentisphaerae bacterium]|nr:RnfABCDGE type electron transport complex subunit G [Lentisphaerota bacterium]
VVLTVICLVAGLLLAWVNDLTAGPIAAAAREEKMAAIRNVLPPCDNDPDADKKVIAGDEHEWTFYVAREEGRYVGAAFEAVSKEGYGGTIRIMVGVTADGNVNGMAVLAHKETPGLGAKIKGDEFRQQFSNWSIRKTRWSVKKDGGDIQAITAATISSRAVAAAMRKGLEVYTAHEEAIRAGKSVRSVGSDGSVGSLKPETRTPKPSAGKATS